MLIVGWALVALISLFVWAADAQPVGRVLQSIREDEDAARSLGKNVFGFKMQSLILGGVIGSLGGLVAGRPDSSRRSPASSPRP